MILLLKTAGWALVFFTPILALLVGADASSRGLAGMMALWTVLPVFVCGMMLVGFAEMVAHVRSIDRAVSAQYSLLIAHRRERSAAPLPRNGRLPTL